MIDDLQVLSYEQTKDTHQFIDVRSPSEYAQDHIPGAVNIPLFTDEQRAQVGTCYVQVDKHQAKRIAAAFVAPKLPAIMDELMALQKQNEKIICYCQRGGYRSRFFAAVFNAVDIRVCRLQGGYKEFRRFVRETIDRQSQMIDWIVLHGHTGVGKTAILSALREAGSDVIDLEAAANHRGSLLGGIGLDAAHPQKWFETLIYEQMSARKTNSVFIEAESDRIGRVFIPPAITKGMKSGRNILIRADLQVRAAVLKKEYGSRPNWREEAEKAIADLQKYVGRNHFAKILHQLKNEDFETTAGILMQSYYDPMYEHKHQSYQYGWTVQNTGDAAQTARLILERLETNREGKA